VKPTVHDGFHVGIRKTGFHEANAEGSHSHIYSPNPFIVPTGTKKCSVCRRAYFLPFPFFVFVCTAVRRTLNRSTHSFFVFPGTASPIAFHRAFFSILAPNLVSAFSKAACWSFVQPSAGTSSSLAGSLEVFLPSMIFFCCSRWFWTILLLISRHSSLVRGSCRRSWADT